MPLPCRLRASPGSVCVQLKSAPLAEKVASLGEADPLPPDDARPRQRSPFLERLYRAHHEGLVRFLRRRGRGDEAHDLVQRVFCRLAGLSAQEQQEIIAPAAYLRRATGNMLRDTARESQRRSAALHISDGETALRAPDPLALLEARDRLRRLETALERLKPRTREIFLAHRIDGYSYAEIAARTGLSIKTVEMHMTRAIAYLARVSESP